MSAEYRLAVKAMIRGGSARAWGRAELAYRAARAGFAPKPKKHKPALTLRLRRVLPYLQGRAAGAPRSGRFT